jgi:alpha-D-ribose 1-methylphosphonate 5-phosphate C-P lyase
VSQNSKRFALQVASFSSEHSIKQERFIIYSVDTGEPITEVTPEEVAEEQSWTAFSPDGTMFVVGSPLKLTLYRLP